MSKFLILTIFIRLVILVRVYLCIHDLLPLSWLSSAQAMFLRRWVWSNISESFEDFWTTGHFSRPLCWEYRQHNSPLSWDLQFEYVICGNLSYMLKWALDIFEDISLSNVSSIPWQACVLVLNHSLKWLALTPPALVKAHLGFDDATIALLPKTKPIVVGPIWAEAEAYIGNSKCIISLWDCYDAVTVAIKSIHHFFFFFFFFFFLKK